MTTQIINTVNILLFKCSRIYGAAFFFPVLSIFLLLPSGIRKRVEKFVNLRFDYFAVIFFYIFILLGVSYVFFPNYQDHVESTIASLGNVMQSGATLYPRIGQFPYNGILYGPALGELQLIFRWFNLPVVVSSKLPGIIALMITATILVKINRKPMARGYLMYLMPFGLMLFWNRSESFLLLISTLSILIIEKLPFRRYSPIILGVLAGSASAFKIHGCFYVFTAYLLLLLVSKYSKISFIYFFVSAILTFFAFFIPPNISLVAFFDYLVSASAHGISFSVWVKTFVYYVFITLPILILWHQSKLTRRSNVFLAVILSLEFFITILASKPGSGDYHLLPFIPVNAFIVERILSVQNLDRQAIIKVIYASLLVPSIAVAFTLGWQMAKWWRLFRAAQQEVASYDVNYPSVLMGITDKDSFQYTYLRVLLSDPQVDYSAFMDLEFSGVDDDEFVKKINACEVESILLPNHGIQYETSASPFSMNNFFTDRPLFSDSLRKAFDNNYSLVNSGEYYDLYMCNQHPYVDN